LQTYVLEEAGVEVDTYNAVVDKYLAEPLIPFHRANSYSWWAENKICFPPLAKLAQRYVFACTSNLCPIRNALFLGLVKYMTQKGTALPLRGLRCCYS